MVVPKGFRKRSRVLVYLIIEGFRDTTILGLRLPIEGDKACIADRKGGGKVRGVSSKRGSSMGVRSLTWTGTGRREIRGFGN